jgi:MSHA biogenesis protein MshP
MMGIAKINRTRNRQAGFSIISAVFLLVVLAALGAFMLTFSASQQATSAQDIQGSRAYQAARAGIEWGLYQVMVVNNANTQKCPGGVASSTTTLPSLAADLAPFTVKVTCDTNQFTEAGVVGYVYFVTSTATLGTVGSVGYIERRLEIRF